MRTAMVVKPTPQPQPPLRSSHIIPVQRTNGKAIASLTIGIISIFVFGIILGPIAICLGLSAKKDIEENPETMIGLGQANAGIICGSIAMIIWVILIIIVYSSHFERKNGAP